MGVAGLWDVLRPAATVRSLTDLAIKEGFQANPNGKRGFRLGIDASIWFFHAEYGKEGENPVLRTLFFRCATLMHTTFLPLFVFDGPKRPDVKRGKKINKTGHKLIPGMKQIVEAFGFEWRMAPGEAEAELAYLNRVGVIDGILSDDVDNFLFGAMTVIRNSSNTLSGNRANPILNSAGKDDKNHTRMFRLQDITNHPDVRLTRGGTILIGLMSGGDYQQAGLMRCGVQTAAALARCGFGDSLYEAAVNLDRESLEDFLVSWRHDLREELKTNSKGEIGRKQVALAKSIPEDFPDIDILLSYVNPITSESMGRASNNLAVTWEREPDLGKLAGVCEFYFEWGYKESIIKRFRTVMWHSIVLRILRRAVLNLDEKGAGNSVSPTTPQKKGKGKEREEESPCGTPSKMIAKHFSSLGIASPTKVYISGSEDEDEDEERLILKIHSFREHTSTDGLPEYRLEIAPKQLVRLAEAGVQGIRAPLGPDEWASDDEEDGEGEGNQKGKKQPIDPDTNLRIWMPACMVKLVEPRLVDDYEDLQEQKRLKKANKGTRKTTTKVKETKTTARKDKEKAPPKIKKAAEALKVVDDSEVFSSLPAEKSKKKATVPSMGRCNILAVLDDESSGSDELPRSIVASKRQEKKKQMSVLDDDFLYEYDLPPQVNKQNKPSTSNAEPLHGGPLNSLNAISSSSVKSRTGIRDLTKKTQSASASTVRHDLKAFFPVARSSATSNLAKKTVSGLSTQLSSTKQSAAPSSSGCANKSISPSSSRAQQAGTSNTLYDSDSACEEYNVGLWDKAGKVSPSVTLSPAKRKTREKSTSSPSESEHSDRLKSSPRKKVTHTSPRIPRRPVSPSPAKFCSKKAPVVIEISSESDSSPKRVIPMKILPPLMRAKARVASSSSTVSQGRTTSKPKNSSTFTLSEDIIDLT